MGSFGSKFSDNLMDNSDDFSSYGKRGETIAQGRPTLTKTSHDQFQVTPSGEVGFKKGGY
jgi:hypothetical protein